MKAQQTIVFTQTWISKKKKGKINLKNKKFNILFRSYYEE